METLHLVMSKLLKKDKKSTVLLERSKVKSTIENLCKEHLQNFEDVLVFESLPNAIDSTLAVISESDLLNRYDFYQETETIFCVRLKEFDLV